MQKKYNRLEKINKVCEECQTPFVSIWWKNSLYCKKCRDKHYRQGEGYRKSLKKYRSSKKYLKQYKKEHPNGSRVKVSRICEQCNKDFLDEKWRKNKICRPCKIKNYMHAYDTSPEGKAKRNAWRKTPKFKAWLKEYNLKNKERLNKYQREWYRKRRQNV